uniref:nutritionally-regulated adipose and cardiac enriched protein homolog isoform X4 n=1 Tax=Pristiophorus japonicus TaxID=55135 RepID=UPI00398E5562
MAIWMKKDEKGSLLGQQEDLDRTMSRLSHTVQEREMSAQHNADCTDDPIAFASMETQNFLVNNSEADSEDHFCKNKRKVQKDLGKGSEDLLSENVDAKDGEECGDALRTLPSHLQEGAGTSDNRALQFVQAEKKYYEAALINHTAMKEESTTEERGSWNSSEKSSMQAQLAIDYKKLTKLCIRDNRSHLALECSGEKMFVSENPVSTRSFERLTSECKVINEADSSRPYNSAISQDSAADQLLDLSNEVLPQRLESTPNARMHEPNVLSAKGRHTQEQVISLKCPTSILRKRSNMRGYEDDDVSHRTRSERRVRFRESDEIIFHTNRCNSHLPAMFWKLLIIILLSLVIMLLYCNESASNIYEQLQSKLNSYYLEMKHTTFSWLTWSRRN